MYLKSRPNLIVIATGLAVALSLFGDMAMYVILPAQNAALGFSAIQVGLLLSVNRWVRLVTNHIAQRLIRRSGTGVVFPLALAVGSLLAAGYAIAPSFAMLLLLRIVWGACWSIIRHTGVMTANNSADPGSRGRNMGLYIALINIGFVSGTLAAGWFYDWGGFQRAFFMATILSLAAIPAALFAQKRAGAISGSSMIAEHDAPEINNRRKIPLSPELSGTRTIGFALTAQGFIVSFVGTGLIMSTLGYMLRERYGDTVNIGVLSIGVTALTGTLLSIRSAINFVGSPVAGAIMDRIGHQRALHPGFGFSGIALLAAGAFGTTAVMTLMIVVFFLGATISRLTVESRAAQKGHRAYAALATATDLGSAIGPMLGWLGIELSQSGLVFWIGGALCLIAAWLRSK